MQCSDEDTDQGVQSAHRENLMQLESSAPQKEELQWTTCQLHRCSAAVSELLRQSEISG